MIWFRRRLNRRRWRARQRARQTHQTPKREFNAKQEEYSSKKKRDVFKLIINTYRHHAGEGRRGERQRGVRRLFRFFERVSFLGGHFVFGGYIYRSRENS